ncbi:MAG: tetratricopeptide repeat protein, partial [Sphingobacteriales bacterium]
FYYHLYNEYYHDFRRAFDYTSRIKAIIERNHVTGRLASSYALVYYWRGDLLFGIGNYKDAYEEYFKGREVGEKVLDACGLSDYNYRLGKVLFQQERYDQSLKQFIECYEQQKVCTESYTFNYRAQEVLGNIGLCYYRLDMPDSAAYYYNAALAFIDRKLIPGTSYQRRLFNAAKAVATGNLGSVYDQLGQDSMAEASYKESIYLNVESGREFKDAMLTSLKLARHYDKADNDVKMHHVLMGSRDMLDSIPDKEAERDWNYLMSRYYAGKDLSQAYNHLVRYEFLQDSLNTVQKALKSSDLREHLNNIERARDNRPAEKQRGKTVFPGAGCGRCQPLYRNYCLYLLLYAETQILYTPPRPAAQTCIRAEGTDGTGFPEAGGGQ